MKNNKGKRKPRSSSVVSYNMSRIKSQGTVIEKLLGSSMHKKGLRYRKQYSIKGKPDFVFVSAKVAVFADSAFWHGRNWNNGAKEQIKTNRAFWIPKIERNIQRDKEVNEDLTSQGWLVMRFWEDEIINNSNKCAEAVLRVVKKRNK